jgi:DNA polymerase-3 subunit epsilon
MNWLSGWLDRFRPDSKPQLSDEQLERLRHWQALPAHDWQQDSRSTRYLVVDVEASGLQIRRDHLISIGAVALDRGVINPMDAFEAVLRQDTVSSTENILIHGISGSEQREGLEPAEALLRFLEYSRHTPLVAYHAYFDQAMIAQAMRRFLGIRYQPKWLDLAWLMPALFPDRYCNTVALDEWLETFGIENFQRHNAISDCLATAQLLQVALQRAAERGIDTPQALAASESLRRRNSW